MLLNGDYIKEQEKQKIMIVDDDAVIRTGLRGIIRKTGLFEIAGEAINGEDFLRQLPHTDVDVVFLDLMMPGIHGSEVARKALEAKPNLKILICSADSSRDEISNLLNIGIFGFILKTEGFEQTIRALHNASQNIPYFSPELVGLVIKHNVPDDRPVKFSAREKEVLRLMCKGMNLQSIATTLFISTRTAEKHRSNMLAKVNKCSTLELVLYAIKNGIVAIGKIDYQSCSVYINSSNNENENENENLCKSDSGSKL